METALICAMKRRSASCRTIMRSAKLAPRDVVARAIVKELERSPVKDPVVYLDLSHLNPDRVKAHFPRIYETCLQYKIDITSNLIPIRPAAHYSMGGVRTDLFGRASLPGLYAAGEAAATGVHGANRLASNSLLEGLVFGARAGSRMRSELKQSAKRANAAAYAMTSNGPLDDATEQVVRNIQDLMWNDVGIVRSAEGLKTSHSKTASHRTGRGPSHEPARLGSPKPQHHRAAGGAVRACA